MGFLKVLFCYVGTLIILSASIYGQLMPNPFNPATNPLGNFPGTLNNFNPGGGNNPFLPNPLNSPSNPANNGPGNFNNFNPLANNPLANNPLANNPLANLPPSFPPGPPTNSDGMLPFLKNLMDQLMNPTSQPPSSPFGFPNNDDGNKPFVPNPPTQPVNNFPPGGLPSNRNQPPLNNFNKPPATPFYPPPANPPSEITPFKPYQQIPINYNPPPANPNYFKPLSIPPQSPKPVPNFGPQPPLSRPPPSPPFHPSFIRGPSNHSFHPHSPPIHHMSPAVHHLVKPPTTPAPLPADGDPLGGHRIVCIFNNKHYFRNEFTPALIDPTICTHINYEFAMLDPKSYEMIASEPELDIQMGFFEEAVKLKQGNKRLKVLISLGGWADSTEKYSILASDAELRKNFVEKAVQFIKTHDFDGMDLAWEYPNCWQGALGISPKDKGNFVLLLEDLSKAFIPEKFILSISVGAVKREIEAAYDIPAVSRLVHFINVMAYDMHGPWEKTTGHHTQFDKLPWDKDPYWNSKGALLVWVKGGADKMKLNLGIAAYGKTFTLADPKNNGLNAKIIGVGDSNIDSVEGGFILYNTMCQWLNDGNWTEKEDRRAGFYAYSGNQWSCYDPPMMCVRKAKYIMEECYGGLLFKDLGGDDYLGKCFSMPFPIVKMARFEMIHRMRFKHHHC